MHDSHALTVDTLEHASLQNFVRKAAKTWNRDKTSSDWSSHMLWCSVSSRCQTV